MISFFVQGNPAPKGSFKTGGKFCKSCRRGSVIVNASKFTKPWEKTIRKEAEKHCSELMKGRVKVRLTFYMIRPKGHYRTGKFSHLLKSSAPKKWHSQMPDIDKLIRCVLDALTNVVYEDDAQVCLVDNTKKLWGDCDHPNGVEIEITEGVDDER